MRKNIIAPILFSIFILSGPGIAFAADIGSVIASPTAGVMEGMPTVDATVGIASPLDSQAGGSLTQSDIGNVNSSPLFQPFGTPETTTGSDVQTDTSNAADNIVNNTAAEAEISEGDINRYLDDILRNGAASSGALGQLFRRLPRYGMSFFRRAPSTYAPMESVPVAQDYRINIGDEMTISMWGIPEEGNYNFTVGRDGNVRIPRVGIVRLAGYTFAEAERILQARLNQYYKGYQMHLSMGKLSSIMIYVTGNAVRPGAYTISSFSTLVNALLASGGPSATGTLRRIELKRNGVTVAIFDMYAMLMRGDKTQDVRLQAGDVIYIPPVGDLVGVAGEIQQPGVYELNGTSRVQDLLYIAGGMNARTFQGRVQFYRIVDHSYASAVEGTLDDMQNIELQDGDIIRLFPVFNFATTVTINGPLISPGVFAIVPGVTRISEIINRGGGLDITAGSTAIITRITPSLEGPIQERFTVDLAQAMAGNPEHNLALEANDKINVMRVPEWKGQIEVAIGGEVRLPGVYYMFPNEKISDLIERAGGFTSKAFLRGAVFTRRSIAIQQRAELARVTEQLELDMLQAFQNDTSSGANVAYQRNRQLLNNLRKIDLIGRIVTKIDTPKNIIGTEWDYELQNGDRLYIPERPLTVNVMGAVYSAAAHTYRSNMSINSYINASGGAIKSAHKRMLYVIKNDGTVLKLTRSTAALTSKAWTAPPGYSAKIEPGDTIVVPVKNMDRMAIENLRDTIDVVYKVAVSAGVIVDLLNDD